MQLLTEQKQLGWRVLLQVSCQPSSTQGVGVLLNCLQSILDDNLLKPDAIRLALQSLLRPAVAINDECIVSFDLLEAACSTLTLPHAPIASLARLMESPESFEQAFHGRRVGKVAVLVEVQLSSEADRRASAGLKALEVSIYKHNS